jgi:hypothetical protein
MMEKWGRNLFYDEIGHGWFDMGHCPTKHYSYRDQYFDDHYDRWEEIPF